jgi:hypothetical protein
MDRALFFFIVFDCVSNYNSTSTMGRIGRVDGMLYYRVLKFNMRLTCKMGFGYQTNVDVFGA